MILEFGYFINFETISVFFYGGRVQSNLYKAHTFGKYTIVRNLIRLRGVLKA